MVTVDYMVRAALRKDNVMSRAMLRACGIDVPSPRPSVGLIVPADAYEGVGECFANHGSPLDGRL